MPRIQHVSNKSKYGSIYRSLYTPWVLSTEPACQGGADVADLAQPQSEGDDAVKRFNDFLAASNVK